ncbi:MAG: hypothetical protein JXX14_22310, partial [Deltaproteobacteria bacterium]|nr:hypothetical protein [Deltaproteobacteria bacterium]
MLCYVIVMSDYTPQIKKSAKSISRRRVLIGAGTVLGAGALCAGGYVTYGLSQRFARDEMAVIPDHRVSPHAAPRMVVARGVDPARNVHAAVERMGGMKRFINRNDVVLVKPNIGWLRTPAHAANTHPETVAQ